MDTRVNVPTRPVVASEHELSDWISYASIDLERRWEELCPALQKCIEAHPAINDGDEETAGIFTDNLRMVNALILALEEFHKKEKAPYWDRGKQIDGWLNAFGAAIEKTEAPLRAALRDFIIRRNRAQVFDVAEPVRGAFGGKATVKDTWTYEVEDITKVPAEYLTVNDKMVKAVLADRNPKTRVPRRKIPGIRWVKNQPLAVS